MTKEIADSLILGRMVMVGNGLSIFYLPSFCSEAGG